MRPAATPRQAVPTVPPPRDSEAGVGTRPLLVDRPRIPSLGPSGLPLRAPLRAPLNPRFCGSERPGCSTTPADGTCPALPSRAQERRPCAVPGAGMGARAVPGAGTGARAVPGAGTGRTCRPAARCFRGGHPRARPPPGRPSRRPPPPRHAPLLPAADPIRPQRGPAGGVTPGAGAGWARWARGGAAMRAARPPSPPP